MLQPRFSFFYFKIAQVFSWLIIYILQSVNIKNTTAQQYNSNVQFNQLLISSEVYFYEVWHNISSGRPLSQVQSQHLCQPIWASDSADGLPHIK